MITKFNDKIILVHNFFCYKILNLTTNKFVKNKNSHK
jgi:hypothetical protein